MEVYHDIKKMLCNELEEYADKRALSLGDIEIIDKLTHSIKSLVTIMAMDDSGYSYKDGYSGTHKRDNMGRYTDDGYSDRRYTRYSRDEGKSHMMHEFERLMENATTQEEREVIQSALSRLKNM